MDGEKNLVIATSAFLLSSHHTSDIFTTRKRKVTTMAIEQEDKIKIGVLALQGSFREHCSMIRRCGGEAVEIRSASQLEGCQGMIIPGGESTTMANIARRWNLFDALRG